MKKKPAKRGLGTLLRLIAFIGVIFSILGIAATWYYRPKIQNTVIGLIDSLDEILLNTNDGLIVMESSLVDAAENLEVISETLDNLNTTMDNISGSLISSADLIGGDLRTTIIDTQTALSSAASSAGLIDNTLRFIASIPLLGADYRPEVPLSDSLGQVSESLDGVPDAFLEIEQFIRDTDSSMVDIKADVSVLAIEIQDYESDLFEVQEILVEYRVIFDDLSSQLSDMRRQTANFLLISSIFITGGFFLLGVSQINIWQLGKNYQNGEQVTVNLAELQRE